MVLALDATLIIKSMIRNGGLGEGITSGGYRIVNEAILMPKTIVMGARLRLRKEAFKDVKARDWQFSGVEKGKLVLWRPEGLVLRAAREDIDWEVHNKPKIED